MINYVVREIYNHVYGKRQISDSYIKLRNEPIKLSKPIVMDEISTSLLMFE